MKSHKIKSTLAWRKPAYQSCTVLNQTRRINPKFCSFFCVKQTPTMWFQNTAAAVYQRRPHFLFTPGVSSTSISRHAFIVLEETALPASTWKMTPHPTVFRQETNSFLRVGLKILKTQTREFKTPWNLFLWEKRNRSFHRNQQEEVQLQSPHSVFDQAAALAAGDVVHHSIYCL